MLLVLKPNGRERVSHIPAASDSIGIVGRILNRDACIRHIVSMYARAARTEHSKGGEPGALYKQARCKDVQMARHLESPPTLFEDGMAKASNVWRRDHQFSAPLKQVAALLYAGNRIGHMLDDVIHSTAIKSPSI